MPSTNSPEEVFLLRNAEALEKIAIFVDLSEGFTVGFVEANLERDRNLAIQALVSRRDNPEIQWIPLYFDERDLRYLIAAITHALQQVELIPNQKVVLLLSGLEKTIGGYGDYPPLLSNLNIARDAYAHKLPYPMLFLLPSYAMTRFARFAPDFWAWKSIEVRLQSNILTPAQSVAEMHTIANDWKVIPVTQARFDLLHRLILDYPQPSLTRADLLNQLGQAYESHINYAKAEQAYKESLDIYSTLNQLSEKAELLNNLAGLCESQGRYAEAEPLYKQALLLRQELLGDRHPDVATSLNNLAMRYSSHGRDAEVEPLLKQALALLQELLGNKHPDVATTISNLAGLYLSQGRYAEAEPLLKQALALRQKLLGNKHPHVSTSINNLAILYKSQGKYAEAEPLYQQALALLQELLGNKHPDVASSLNNLAELYRSQGRYAEAEPLYQQALALKQELLGNKHPNVAISLNNLASLYFSQGRYEEAEPLYQQALALRQELLGDKHPHVAHSLNNLALLYSSQGRYEEAESKAKAALAIFLSVLGENNPRTLNSLLSVKGLRVQNLLQCDRPTLFAILKALAQKANLPTLDTEAMLYLLEAIATNPELLQALQQAMSQQT